MESCEFPEEYMGYPGSLNNVWVPDIPCGFSMSFLENIVGCIGRCRICIGFVSAFGASYNTHIGRLCVKY